MTILDELAAYARERVAREKENISIKTHGARVAKGQLCL